MASDDFELDGLRLPEPWRALRDKTRAASLARELRAELPKGHILSGRDFEVVAWTQGASDDILVRLLDSPGKFAAVHLTWVHPDRLHYPHADLYDSLSAWITAWEEESCG